MGKRVWPDFDDFRQLAYETRYFPATDSRGTCVGVRRMEQGAKWRKVAWDYSVNWGETQHRYAVEYATDKKVLAWIGETKDGYVYLVDNEGE